jgi:hypothetical protein
MRSGSGQSMPLGDTKQRWFKQNKSQYNRKHVCKSKAKCTRYIFKHMRNFMYVVVQILLLYYIGGRAMPAPSQHIASGPGKPPMQLFCKIVAQSLRSGVLASETPRQARYLQCKASCTHRHHATASKGSWKATRKASPSVDTS